MMFPVEITKADILDMSNDFGRGKRPVERSLLRFSPPLSDFYSLCEKNPNGDTLTPLLLRSLEMLVYLFRPAKLTSNR